jgi:hypothetical protein
MLVCVSMLTFDSVFIVFETLLFCDLVVLLAVLRVKGAFVQAFIPPSTVRFAPVM